MSGERTFSLRMLLTLVLATACAGQEGHSHMHSATTTPTIIAHTNTDMKIRASTLKYANIQHHLTSNINIKRPTVFAATVPLSTSPTSLVVLCTLGGWTGSSALSSLECFDGSAQCELHAAIATRPCLLLPCTPRDNVGCLTNV